MKIVILILALLLLPVPQALAGCGTAMSFANTACYFVDEDVFDWQSCMEGYLNKFGMLMGVDYKLETTYEYVCLRE